MSKKNWFLIIGLASLALIFLSFVVYVAKKTNEKNAEKFEEIKAYRRPYQEKADEEEDEIANIVKKIALLIQNFQQKFTNDKDANLIISDNKYNIADKENQINDDFLKSLENFLGKLNANLKKLNEIKFDSSKIQKKINEPETTDCPKEIINEMQEYFNKCKEDYYNIIKDANKIFFTNSENKDNSKEKDKYHNLIIIQNEELIINPEISKCFTTKQLDIINKSKEEAEKNLNPPNTIIQDSNFRSPARQIP